MNIPVHLTPDVTLTERQRHYVQLTAFVLAQHGQHERADTLLAALCAAGGETPHVLLSRAVMRYYIGDYRQAIELLEAIDQEDPIEKFGMQKLTRKQKLRRYLKARCFRELGNITRTKDAVDIYLRRKSTHAPAPGKK